MRREQLRERRLTKMSSSWIHPIQLLLLLLYWGGINTNTVVTPHPLNDTPPPVNDAVSKSVVLKGESHIEHIELLKPIHLELDCNWHGNEDKLPNITGYWTKDGNEINSTRLTVQMEKGRYNLKQVFHINEESLGNYSCVFSAGERIAKIDFHLTAPKMTDMKDKPIVAYVGEFVVIGCKMKSAPVTWRWYRTNGTDKELIDANADPPRYEIHTETNVDGNQESKLTVLKLTTDDAGTYLCSAVYDIGASTGHVQLRVITFLEPLKVFAAILVEVIVLVFLIFLYEMHSSRKKSNSATGNGMHAEQTNKLTQGEQGMDDDSTVRQRKV